MWHELREPVLILLTRKYHVYQRMDSFDSFAFPSNARKCERDLGSFAAEFLRL